jgi:peptidoglycan/LPS O-acetylase OafA/YrhL
MLVSNASVSDIPNEVGQTDGRAEIRKSAFYMPALDGIRGIAFLLVFFSHSEVLGNIIPGGFGVTIFFFLSGYLITTLLRIEVQKTGTVSLRKFYVRRARRILPPVYLTLGLAYLLGYLGILSSPGSRPSLLATVFYYYNYFELLTHGPGLPTGLSVVWSLMIEEHFYLLFPLAYLLVSRGLSRRIQALIFTGACGLAMLWRFFLVYVLHTSTTFNAWTYSATDARFDSILWGCILAIASNPWYQEDRDSSFLNKFKGTWALLGLGGLLASFVWRSPEFRETARYTLQGIALYPIFFYFGVAKRGAVLRMLEFKPLMTIGHLSYSMYLIHLLILQTLLDHFMIGRLANTCLALVLTTIYALIMRTLVENPLHKLIP